MTEGDGGYGGKETPSRRVRGCLLSTWWTAPGVYGSGNPTSTVHFCFDNPTCSIFVRDLSLMLFQFYQHRKRPETTHEFLQDRRRRRNETTQKYQPCSLPAKPRILTLCLQVFNSIGSTNQHLESQVDTVELSRAARLLGTTHGDYPTGYQPSQFRPLHQIHICSRLATIYFKYDEIITPPQIRTTSVLLQHRAPPESLHERYRDPRVSFAEAASSPQLI